MSVSGRALGFAAAESAANSGDSDRFASPRSRTQTHAVIVDLRANGLTNDEIGRFLGISRSQVRNILYDPDGSKQKARRARYQGTCRVCGAATDGSNGRAKAPEVCHICAPEELKRWTRQAIIESVQAWAAEHGRPPTATDWMRAGPDHPAASSTFGPDAQFDYWADVIEAAGFPRPLIGIYGDRRPWDHDSIIEAIRAWAKEHGRPPVMNDWPSGGHSHPCANTVAKHFGYWTAAIEAAGFERARVGRRKAVAA